MSKIIEITDEERLQKVKECHAVIEGFLDTFFKMMEDKTDSEDVKKYAASLVNYCEEQMELCDMDSEVDNHHFWFYTFYATWSVSLCSRLINKGE